MTRRCQRTRSEYPLSASRLLAVSSEGKGSEIAAMGKAPRVEYLRFMSDSTLDLSFCRTRGGGGSVCEDVSGIAG